MKFSRPIVFFDLEATGLDVAKDRIVEFAAKRFVPKINDERLHARMRLLIDPGIPIPPEVTEIHGITNDDLKESPKFADVAKSVHAFMEGCLIAGFNLINFDVPMLWEEFYRCGIEWKIEPKDIIDCGNIFKLKHPRDLSAAVKTYCGREHVDAHSALADVEATADVLRGQLDKHDDLFEMSEEELSKFCRLEDRIDLSGIIVRNKEGVPVFNTKRNKGVPVINDVGYAQWMLRNDFSANTRMHIERILAQP